MRLDFKFQIELYIPSYSPNLTSSDFYLFSILKTGVKGYYFDIDQELKNYILDYFLKVERSPL